MKSLGLYLMLGCLAGSATAATAPDLTAKIPPRPALAPSGCQFVKSIAQMDRHRREQAILDAILQGDLPAFLRRLVPVKLTSKLPGARTLTATIFVMPDYLAIGSDSDFLRIPMNLETATAIALRTGFILPTRKMVDAIYEQAAFHFTPQPLPAGPRMTSTEYYEIHNEKINGQSAGIRLGELVSGDKKDVVITNRLASHPGRIAIYGWHRLTGVPIQPLSTVHGVCYADYSHGIRLVSAMALVNGALRSIYDLLQDPLMAKIFSDEGPIRKVWEFGSRDADQLQCGLRAQPAPPPAAFGLTAPAAAPSVTP